MVLLSLNRAMKPKLGIVAGGGVLPRLVAETCIKENGRITYSPLQIMLILMN